MTGRRGGRIQVNALQFAELSARVEALEKLLLKKDDVITKKEVMQSLDNAGITYNPRDKKEALLSLLEV